MFNNCNTTNLSSNRAAKVILNIVTGDKVSKINGKASISGTAADVIVINPNGFVLKNTEFQNVKKITFITGWPISTKAGNISVAINPCGEIVVRGKTDYVKSDLNLIAGKIKIDGTIVSGGAVKIMASGGVASHVRRDWKITGLLTSIQKNKSVITTTARSAIIAKNVKIITFDKGDNIKLCGTIKATKYDIVIDSVGDI